MTEFPDESAIPASTRRTHGTSLLRGYGGDDPVHRHADSPYGPYWSVTRFADIMKVELNSPPSPRPRNGAASMHGVVGKAVDAVYC